MLILESLSAGYGHDVFSGISARFEKGTVTGILGHNGCGKTTLLRAVAGSLPYRGSVRYGETDLSSLSSRRRAGIVTLMTQKPPSAVGITALEYVSFAFCSREGIFGGNRKKQRERIYGKAEELGIKELLSRDLSRLSVGEGQMVSLLRVILQDTPVVLLDEPAGALDPDHTKEVYSRMRMLAENGKTVLCVLHDPAAALRYCDILYLLHDGNLSAPFRTSDPDPAAEAFLSSVYGGLHVGRDEKTNLRYIIEE